MTEDEARRVELVRAIEIEDRDAQLLTKEDRRQADAFALSNTGTAPNRNVERRFIVSRASFAAARLETRHPGIQSLLARSRWPRWIAWTIPLVALVLGFIANEFGTGRRLDLLAVPLLGTIAWNLIVYIWILGAALTGRGKIPTLPTAWFAALGQRGFDKGSALDRAAASFRERWSRLSAGLASARTARTFHLGAAMFAAGLIGGVYLRALVMEYRAGWESTFLGPEAVRALLSVVLAPASFATGIGIPSTEGIAAMRWTGRSTGGVHAGPWIYLYTATVIWLIIVPRLLLALWQGAKAMRLARNFPVAGREDFYLRRLMRAAGNSAGSVRVTPYAYRPNELVRRNLTAALRGVLGDDAAVKIDEAVEYGAEDSWLDARVIDPSDDYHVLIFTLSATPEEENHGALARMLAESIARDCPGTVLAAIIDDSAYRSHFAGQAGLDERIATRLAAWRQVLSNAGLTALCLDLSQEPDEAFVLKLEGGLLPDGALRA